MSSFYQPSAVYCKWDYQQAICGADVCGSLKFMFVITVYDYICVYDSSKSSSTLNKTSSAFTAPVKNHNRKATPLCKHRTDLISLVVLQCIYCLCLSLSDIPLMLAAQNLVPNMESFPYSKPLWSVSEEAGLDRQSKFSRDGKFTVPENLRDHMLRFLRYQC